jgi:hypothetical protein
MASLQNPNHSFLFLAEQSLTFYFFLQENFNRLAFWNAQFCAISVVKFGYKNYLLKFEDK